MSIEWSWCPQCKKWVPAKLMNYEIDERGMVIQVCTPCLEGTETDYVKDEEHGLTRCIYCDSSNTVELAPNWNKFKCNDCGETFRRLV